MLGSRFPWAGATCPPNLGLPHAVAMGINMAQLSMSHRVLWVQVWGLATVQGAIALCWVIYNLYLLSLLQDAGFPKTLAALLLIVENLLAAVMEPLMGSLSDRTQRWVGTRFPFIAAGTVLAAISFILIPTIALFGSNAGPTRWVLPGIMIAWALAMTVFRSPAMSLLGRYAFATNLPQAASILTLVGGLAGAMGPLAGDVILGWGPQAAFLLGSVVLLAAALALWLVNPRNHARQQAEARAASTRSPESLPISIPALALVFGAGVGVGLGFRLLMGNFPRVLVQNSLEGSKGLILGMIFVALALTAIPAGVLATRLGNHRAMITGLGGMAVFCMLAMLSQSAVMSALLAIALGATFSLVSNGTLPFALGMVPAEKAGLGTGMYFSGGAMANSLFGLVFNSPEAMSPVLGGMVGAIAFLLAGGCVALATRLPAPTKIPN
jgi:Na+/melibiose symporter-like transporter